MIDASDPIHSPGDRESELLTAIDALVAALDSAGDRADVERRLRAWSSAQLGCDDVAIELGRRPAASPARVDVRGGDDGATVFSVDAAGRWPARLVFHCALPRERVDDRLLRTLLVVGRLFGSALARVQERSCATRPPSATNADATEVARPLFGNSARAQELTRLIARLAQTDVSVLIDGETGVGKTFVARLIHQASGRARAPLRIVNCSAMPETLIESALFGHERGAFTGATSTRIGVLEAAADGTIVLDEVGELSLASQAKLLHVLEERRFERVGSHRGIDLRARVLLATNRDLDQMVRLGQFRKDLLFRISVVRLTVPPLRERGDDILLLAERILANCSRTPQRAVDGFTPEALQRLRSHSWPGNVRELRNAVEHALALGDTPLIRAEDLPIGDDRRPGEAVDVDVVHLPSSLAVLERRAIDASLRATNGNRLRAAQLLGVTRQTLYNKLKTHKL